MTININNKDYNFDLSGTVGLVYLCQKMLDHEPDFSASPTDRITLYYCAFTTSNGKEKDLPDLMQFIASMTTKLLNEIDTFFWKRWRELEGTTDKEDDPKEEGKKGEA